MTVLLKIRWGSSVLAEARNVSELSVVGTPARWLAGMVDVIAMASL